MKKINLFLIILLFFLLTSCEFLNNIFNNNTGKFKEKVDHKILWQKVYSYTHTAQGPHEFDGKYFYISMIDDTCQIKKYDLNGNDVWGKPVDLTEESGDSYVRCVRSIKKIDNKLYIVTGDDTLDRVHQKLLIIDADTGSYYGSYPLIPDEYRIDTLSPDYYGNYVYITYSSINYDNNGNEIDNFHIYVFKRFSNSPELVYERVFKNTKVTISGSKYIYDGKMYLKAKINGKRIVLWVLDAEAIANSSKTNNECVIKEIEKGNYETDRCNILKKDNLVISTYHEKYENGDVKAHFICFNESDNYSTKWDVERKIDAWWTDIPYYNNKFFDISYIDEVACFSIDTGKMLWKNNNYIWTDPNYEGNNNNGAGCVIDGKWYAQSASSDMVVIIYDIETGEKVGRIENMLISNNPDCLRSIWSAGNKLYVITWGGYFNCFEITWKKSAKIFPVIKILSIFIFLMVMVLVVYNKVKRIKKRKSSLEINDIKEIAEYYLINKII